MKLRLFIVAILMICGCSNDDSTQEEGTIYGRWKLVRAFISAGGPQYWVDIENGSEYTFKENGEFTASDNTECQEGSFALNNRELALTYGCEGFVSEAEDENGKVTYNAIVKGQIMDLTPTSIICIEGCTYRYQRQ